MREDLVSTNEKAFIVQVDKPFLCCHYKGQRAMLTASVHK